MTDFIHTFYFDPLQNIGKYSGKFFIPSNLAQNKFLLFLTLYFNISVDIDEMTNCLIKELSISDKNVIMFVKLVQMIML